MPWIDVKLYDSRVTEESVPKIIESLTKALAESSGAAPEHIQVVVQGVSPEELGRRRKTRGLIARVAWGQTAVCPHAGSQAGLMFAFRWNRLPGSYVVFRSTSRS